MPTGYAPLYYCSAVIPDGRLVVIGGEYNYQFQASTQTYTYVSVETNKGAIYDPKTKSWTNLAPPTGINRIGDSMCNVLTTGANAGNYTVTPVNGTLTITPLNVTITANDASRVFGSPNPVFTANVVPPVTGLTPSPTRSCRRVLRAVGHALTPS